ncbi:MAG: hypothetical protein IJA34_11615 [Lachnospiraceae bacterium]|nr:hypothetical protein [Lachnospiraceae bacterium]
MIRKKIKSIIAVVLLLNYALIIPNFEVSADEINKSRKNEESIFSKDREKFKNINKKIKEEMESHTDLLDEDIEIYLNENGVYDREIEKIKGVEYMSGLNKEDIQIFSAYYSVEDNPQKTDVPITDGEMQPLSGEEINNLIGNIYYGENNDISKKEEKINKDGVFDKFLTAVGIKPVEAYAAVYEAGGDNESYLKKTMIVYSKKVNGKECYEVIYFSTWETMPKYRNVDVVSLHWANATWQPYLNSNVVVKQNWDVKRFYFNSLLFKEVLKDESYTTMFEEHSNPDNLKSSQYFISEKGIVAVLDLHDDIIKSFNVLGIQNHDITTYSNEELVIQLYLEKDKYKDTVIFYPYYQHYKNSYNVKSVTMSIIGAIVGGINKNAISVVYSLAGGIMAAEYDMVYCCESEPWSYNYTYK